MGELMRAKADEETALAVEKSLREDEMRRQMSEDTELQKALALSAEVAQPEPRLVDYEDAIMKAIRESEREAQVAEKKRIEAMRAEDEGALFQAALRASKVDLGPRGISQAAKIMVTGDESLGQAAVVLKTNSHAGAGGVFHRVPSGASLPGIEKPAAAGE